MGNHSVSMPMILQKKSLLDASIFMYKLVVSVFFYDIAFNFIYFCVGGTKMVIFVLNII